MKLDLLAKIMLPFMEDLELTEADLLDYEEDLEHFELEPLSPEDLGWGEDYLETDDYEEEEQ